MRRLLWGLIAAAVLAFAEYNRMGFIRRPLDLQAWGEYCDSDAGGASCWESRTALTDSELRAVCPHIIPVNVSCPRFIAFSHLPNAGLGHKLTEMLFAWRMARELRATYLTDLSAFSSSDHHSYDWAVTRFGLAEGEVMTVAASAQLYSPVVVTLCPYNNVTLRDTMPTCNVVYRVPHYTCCNYDCFQVMAGLFEEQKECLRGKYRTSAARFLPIPSSVDQDYIAIVWHLRVGDVALHGNDEKFFKNVWAFISKALSPLPMRNYFVGESRPAIDNYFPFLATFPAASVHALGVVPSMTMMQDADVLVGSGSSFPQVVGLTSTDTVFLNHEPKHDYKGMEHLSDAPFLWRNGTVSATAEEFRAQVLQKACRRRCRLRSPPAWVSVCKLPTATST